MIQADLPPCRFYQIGAAYHLSHALINIIQHHSKIVSKQTISAFNNEIFFC
ncbi:Uncharacterised protein [Vibrio cholerae]|nr:Uncharacterised protein [Vibrio cholerae]